MNEIDISNKENKTQNYNLWYHFLDELKKEYGISIYNTWFIHLNLQDIKKDVITITAPSKFIREWIVSNYFPKMKEIVNNFDSTIKILDLRVNNKRSSKDSRKDNDTQNFFYERNSSPQIKNDSSNKIEISIASRLNENYIFDTFVVGKSNQMAYAAALAFAEGKKEAIDRHALYIHGTVGMGKTHLLQAITKYYIDNKSYKKVAYLSAEKFMHNFIMSSQNNNIIDFKEQLRSLDVLLIDDIQFICGKNKTIKEFANTVNAIIEAGKIVVVSSDRSPYHIDLDDRTKSRLSAGVVADIKNPDIELRKEILSRKAKLIDIQISDDIIDFINNNINFSIRELEGALNKIATHASLMNIPITQSLVNEILQDCIDAQNKTISVDKIMETVANYYGVTASDIISKSRLARYVYPRQVLAFIAKQTTDISLKTIGEKLGNRDHATIIYSIKKLENRIAEDETVARDIAKILDIIGNTS